MLVVADGCAERWRQRAVLVVDVPTACFSTPDPVTATATINMRLHNFSFCGWFAAV
jgi:hypothetical protein